EIRDGIRRRGIFDRDEGDVGIVSEVHQAPVVAGLGSREDEIIEGRVRIEIGKNNGSEISPGAVKSNGIGFPLRTVGPGQAIGESKRRGTRRVDELNRIYDRTSQDISVVFSVSSGAENGADFAVGKGAGIDTELVQTTRKGDEIATRIRVETEVKITRSTRD